MGSGRFDGKTRAPTGGESPQPTGRGPLPAGMRFSPCHELIFIGGKFGDGNVAVYYLSFSRQRTADRSGRIPRFHRFVPDGITGMRKSGSVRHDTAADFLWRITLPMPFPRKPSQALLRLPERSGKNRPSQRAQHRQVPAPAVKRSGNRTCSGRVVLST